MPNSIVKDCIPFVRPTSSSSSTWADYTQDELESALALMDPEDVETLRRFVLGETQP